MANHSPIQSVCLGLRHGQLQFCGNGCLWINFKFFCLVLVARMQGTRKSRQQWARRSSRPIMTLPLPQGQVAGTQAPGMPALRNPNQKHPDQSRGKSSSSSPCQSSAPSWFITCAVGSSGDLNLQQCWKSRPVPHRRRCLQAVAPRRWHCCRSLYPAGS